MELSDEDNEDNNDTNDNDGVDKLEYDTKRYNVFFTPKELENYDWKAAKTFINHHELSVVCLCLLRDGTVLSSSRDSTIRRWSVEAPNCGEWLQQFVGHTGVVHSVVQPRSSHNDNDDYNYDDDDEFVSCSLDGTVRKWSIKSGKQIGVLLETNQRLTAFCELVKAKTKAEINTSGTEAPTTTLTTSGVITTKTMFVVGSLDGEVWVLKDTGEVFRFREDQSHTERVSTVCALRNHRREVLSGSWDKTINLWDMVRGCCIHTYKGHEERIEGVAEINSDRMASTSDSHLRIWKLTGSRCCVRVMRAPSQDFKNPVKLRGNLLCSTGKPLRVWDMETGTKVGNVWICSTITSLLEVRHGVFLAGTGSGYITLLRMTHITFVYRSLPTSFFDIISHSCFIT